MMYKGVWVDTSSDTNSVNNYPKKEPAQSTFHLAHNRHFSALLCVRNFLNQGKFCFLGKNSVCATHFDRSAAGPHTLDIVVRATINRKFLKRWMGKRFWRWKIAKFASNWIWERQGSSGLAKNALEGASELRKMQKNASKWNWKSRDRWKMLQNLVFGHFRPSFTVSVPFLGTWVLF